MIIWYLFWIKMYKNWIFNVSMQKDCTVCVLNDLKPFCVQYFLKFFVFFWCLKFCPACISLLLAHIWILHKILGRNALFLERFKNFCLKSKYPNRVLYSSTKLYWLLKNILIFLSGDSDHCLCKKPRKKFFINQTEVFAAHCKNTLVA